ncbi:hypothetical protein GH741_03090 [Aquibacillus halophilus]|uniref:Flavoprotein n=1 Tax=Aquibacillus halophilus TaxID=930132 RepID=A0A6A8DFM7_9BACI|nr:hypothetical protein [Aquibacillus halophilus]MRH41657.1 hypothetical protein [Aquibacillus halophilus]
MKEAIRELVQQALNDLLPTKSTYKDRKDILILLVYEASNAQLVIETIKALSIKHNVTLCVDNAWKLSQERPLDNTTVISMEDCCKEELDQLLNQSDLLYVPTISYGLLAKICLLIDDDIPSWLIIQTQLKGKEVVIANDQIPSSGSTIFMIKPSIEKRIQNYWKQIREDGVHVSPTIKVQQKIANLSKKKPVILAKHIEKISVQGEKELTLPKGSILTPMGKDIARELGITVKRENDETRDQK